MSKRKRKEPEVIREINPVTQEVKRDLREKKQKSKGDNVVKWIFISLLVLSILYMIWTMTAVA